MQLCTARASTSGNARRCHQLQGRSLQSRQPWANAKFKESGQAGLGCSKTRRGLPSSSWGRGLKQTTLQSHVSPSGKVRACDVGSRVLEAKSQAK